MKEANGPSPGRATRPRRAHCLQGRLGCSATCRGLPTGISANIGIRFCPRVMDQGENDMVLGTSSYKRGVRATEFAGRDKGIGYLAGHADDVQVVKTCYIDAVQADEIGRRARPDVGTDVTQALRPSGPS